MEICMYKDGGGKTITYILISFSFFKKFFRTHSMQDLSSMTRDRNHAHGAGQEDPLKEDIATHSSNLDWKIPWTEEPGGL